MYNNYNDKFEIGDVVCLKDRIAYLNIRGDQNYRVTGVTNGSHGQLIRIGRLGSQFDSPKTIYKAKNFRLAATAVKPVIPAAAAIADFPSVIVLSTMDKGLMKKFLSIESAEQWIESRLAATPTDSFHIFKYEKTGRAPPVSIQWEVK